MGFVETGRPVPDRASGPAAEASAEPDRQVLVARHGIYDVAQQVIAYELLYRKASTSTQADVIDGRRATLRVITNAILEIGLDRLAGEVPVHINYPEELLIESQPLPVPAKRVVIEVLEGVRAEPAVMEGIKAMRGRGHRIAIDDYSPATCDAALLDVADMVKVDIAQHPREELPGLLEALKKRNLSVVAERVETAEDFKLCSSLGFDAFQGYFLQHPGIFSSRPVPSSRLGTLRLVSILQSDESSIHDVEQLVSQDGSLSYRILRCINSSYYNFDREIDSIRQAVMVLGFEKLRQLCALIALEGLEDRPPTVLIEAMTRARMCERLGTLRGSRNTPALFIVGLFSTLDVMTGIPMAELLQGLPLSPPIVRGLTAGDGQCGAILKEVLAVSRGEWIEARFPGIRAAAIQKEYVDAIAWAEATQALISR